MQIKHITNYQEYKNKLFIYYIYNLPVNDVHYIHINKYSIKLEFYTFSYWILDFMYYSDKNCISLYLPTCNISIYSK